MNTPTLPLRSLLLGLLLQLGFQLCASLGLSTHSLQMDALVVFALQLAPRRLDLLRYQFVDVGSFLLCGCLGTVLLLL